jgi:hypothetical protein
MVPVKLLHSKAARSSWVQFVTTFGNGSSEEVERYGKLFHVGTVLFHVGTVPNRRLVNEFQ